MNCMYNDLTIIQRTCSGYIVEFGVTWHTVVVLNSIGPGHVPEVMQFFPNSCYLRAGESVLLRALVVGVGVVGTCSTRERIKSKASELFVI